MGERERGVCYFVSEQSLTPSHGVSESRDQMLLVLWAALCSLLSAPASATPTSHLSLSLSSVSNTPPHSIPSPLYNFSSFFPNNFK